MPAPGDYSSIRVLPARWRRAVFRGVAGLPPQRVVPRGVGHLAGEFPDGITSVEGVPVSAEVLAKLRMPGTRWDGMVVARTTSGADGTWLIADLNPGLRYDVVGRKDGQNDVIMADVTPVV